MARARNEDGPGGSSKRPATPPKPPKWKDVYTSVRQQNPNLSEGEAKRATNIYINTTPGTEMDWSGVYAGYRSGQGGSDAAVYGPATVGSFTAPGADSSFIGTAASDSAFAGVANALLPYLAPTAQNSVRQYLSENYSNLYGGYKDVKSTDYPEVTSEIRNQFLNAERARNARNAINNMLTATGVSSNTLGAGYTFLDNIISALEKYGGSPMNRETYQKFSDEVDALISKAEDNPEAQPYASLGKFFAKPIVGGQGLMDLRQNRRLFT